VVAYRDVGNSNYGTGVVGTVSGSTISYGSEYVFNSGGTRNNSAAAFASTHFVVVYRDVGASSYGTAVIGDIGGALPVRLSSFTANYVNNSVVLDWTTESLGAGLGFIIERQIAGSTDWQEIASYLTNNSLVAMNNPLGTANYGYTDHSAEASTQYSYRLSDIDINGNVTVLEVVEVLTTGAKKEFAETFPENYSLIGAYPNPFNPQTTIVYGLPKSEKISLRIYNLRGELVKELVSGFKHAGNYSAVWNGKDFTNTNVNSGIYFIHLQAGHYFAVKKVTLLR